MSSSEESQLNDIVFFPTVIDHPEHGKIRIVGYSRPHEYQSGVYAFEDPETSEYGGMLVEDDTTVTVLNSPTNEVSGENTNTGGDDSNQFELPDSAPVYASEHVEVSVEDSDGYITISPSRGEPFTFSVDTGEIEAFCEQQQRDISLPEPPEGFEESRDGPDQWSAGKLVHTGGGIWCRIWERPIDENENGRRIQVLYPIPDCIGVTAELHDPDGYHIGTITDKAVKTDLNKIDEHCAKLANDIMEEIDAGEHDGTISKITDEE